MTTPTPGIASTVPGAGAPSSDPAVDLLWIPLGAGGHVVASCGRVFERLSAWRHRRHPRPIYHAALEVTVSGARYVIEMGPVWTETDRDRGVVVEGPVGIAPLGRWRAFRYEVRCWPGGRIPDRAWAEADVRVSDDDECTAAVLAAVRTVPALTWGRDQLGLGDMWNSNSLVAWLLSGSGVDLSHVVPPCGGRAPGWRAGLSLAERELAARITR